MFMPPEQLAELDQVVARCNDLLNRIIVDVRGMLTDDDPAQVTALVARVLENQCPHKVVSAAAAAIVRLAQQPPASDTPGEA
jgi:hypothetical protein